LLKASQTARIGLLTVFAPSRLQLELNRVPLWRGDHVAIRQLVEDFARYLYLPRLKDPSVLLGAVREGFTLLTWEKDSFAYADGYDEDAGRYRGLRAGELVPIGEDAPGLLVKPEVARAQLEAEVAVSPGRPPTATPGDEEDVRGPGTGTTPVTPPAESTPSPRDLAPKRFHGSVTLDESRVGRDAGRIAEEVIAHLTGLMGANVRVTLEIEADIRDGAPEHVVRTVTENSRELKFTSHGFEKE
jgi:hypothetical protein